jgi:hypothetical protein
MTKVAPAGTVGGCNGETYIFAPSHDGQFGKALTAAQPGRCAHFVEAIHLPLGNTCLRKLRLRCAIEVEQGCAAQGPPPTRHTVPARLSATGWVSPSRRPHAGPGRDARTVAGRSRTISACPVSQPAPAGVLASPAAPEGQEESDAWHRHVPHVGVLGRDDSRLRVGVRSGCPRPNQRPLSPVAGYACLERQAVMIRSEVHRRTTAAAVASAVSARTCDLRPHNDAVYGALGRAAHTIITQVRSARGAAPVPPAAPVRGECTSN